jgi:membrane-bound serine protease (ClpP class)
VIFIITLVLALLFFPWPWNLVVIAAAAAFEVLLATMGVRYTHRGRNKVGAETMIGKLAEVSTPLIPTGQVKVDGVIWQAHSATEAREGDTVRITGIHGLTLEVEPAPAP